MIAPIENVVFDLGGVLVDIDIDRCIAAFERLGMPQIAGIIDACHPAAMIGELEGGKISFHEACERMRVLSNSPDIDDEAIAKAYGEFLTGVPVEKIRMVDALRRRGIRTYVLSNNNPASMAVIRRMFAADGRMMEDYFDRIYLSYEMKLLKPSPEIFRAMIADSGMSPERTLYIDDSPANAEAARREGFAVYVPAPHEDFSHLFAE